MVQYQLGHGGERLVLELVHLRGGYRIPRCLAKFRGSVHPEVERLLCRG